MKNLIITLTITLIAFTFSASANNTTKIVSSKAITATQATEANAEIKFNIIENNQYNPSFGTAQEREDIINRVYIQKNKSSFETTPGQLISSIETTGV
jgi:hypothetical protein